MTQETKTARQKQVVCDCGSTFREDTDDRLVEAVKRHAREIHDMEMSRDQILSMAEWV